MNIDWERLESTLYSVTLKSVDLFSEQHENEVFYGFAYDCNSYYGEVGICFNTEESLNEWARTMYPEMSIDKINDELRWDPGDWKYQGINYDGIYVIEELWESEWNPMASQVFNAIIPARIDSAEAFRRAGMITDRFLSAVCRVLIDLETSSAFNCLKRTHDFKIFTIDNDEDIIDGWNRLNRIREKL